MGQLVVGFVDSTEIVLEILKNFRERFPEIQLVLREMTTEQQLKALYEKEIHIGFFRTKQNNGILSSEVCSEESLKLVLPQNHPLASLPEVSLQLLVDEPFIMFPRHLGPDFYDFITSYFSEQGVNLNVVQEAIQMQTIVNLVAIGMGISVVPSSVETYKQYGVIYKNFKETSPKINLYVGWRQDGQSAMVNQFLTIVREEYCTYQSTKSKTIHTFSNRQ